MKSHEIKKRVFFIEVDKKYGLRVIKKAGSRNIELKSIVKRNIFPIVYAYT